MKKFMSMVDLSTLIPMTKHDRKTMYLPCSLQTVMSSSRPREPRKVQSKPGHISQRTRNGGERRARRKRKLFTGYGTRESTVKKLVNESNSRLLLSSNMIRNRRSTNAMIIDGIDAKSSYSMIGAIQSPASELNPDKCIIHAINFDKRAEQHILTAGAKPFIGRSTDFLKQTSSQRKDQLFITYLDYTGTPSGNFQLGINPEEDMILAKSCMERYSFMLVTFSRRGEPDADKYARQIIGDSGFDILDEFMYRETSPMLLYLCCTPRTPLWARGLARGMYNPLRLHLDLPPAARG